VGDGCLSQVVQVVLRPQGSKGFVLLPKRWVVERTFGWLMNCRQLVRDDELLPETSETFIYLAMIPNRTIDAILFDLDGTLSDPKPGITRSIQYALSELGYASPSAEDLLWCIGPPLHQSFADLLQTSDPDIIQQAILYYRDRYASVGLFENRLYPEIPAILTALRATGYRTFVATSKPQVFAEQIIQHFSLSPLFDRVYGSELDGTRSHKGDLIQHILIQEKIAPAQAVMIGDRKHDLIAARQNGIQSIGVTYGYGDRAELEAAAADAIVDDLNDLFTLLA
jgi:phosphoglycolate phosphatase